MANGALIHLVVYGESNLICCPNGEYALGIDICQLKKNDSDLKLNLNTHLHQCQYVSNNSNNSDEFEIIGLEIELNEIATNTPYLYQIAINAIMGSSLRIFASRLINNDAVLQQKILGSDYFISQIPLYLTTITTKKNIILLKFKKKFFSPHQSHYFFGFFTWKFVLDFEFDFGENISTYNNTNNDIDVGIDIGDNPNENFDSSILIKKINLIRSLKYINGPERTCLAKYLQYFASNTIKSSKRITDPNKIKEKITTLNCEKCKIIQNINCTELIEGFYFNIPCELIEFVSEINISLGNYTGNCTGNCTGNKFGLKFTPIDTNDLNMNVCACVSNDVSNDVSNVYWLGFDGTNIKTCPNDYVEIEFDSGYLNYLNLSNDTKQIEFEKILEWVRYMHIDVITINTMIGKAGNLKLKYTGGELNNDLTSDELELISKYENMEFETRMLDTIANNYNCKSYNNSPESFLLENPNALEYCKNFASR